MLAHFQAAGHRPHLRIQAGEARRRTLRTGSSGSLPAPHNRLLRARATGATYRRIQAHGRGQDAPSPPWASSPDRRAAPPRDLPRRPGGDHLDTIRACGPSTSLCANHSGQAEDPAAFGAGSRAAADPRVLAPSASADPARRPRHHRRCHAPRRTTREAPAVLREAGALLAGLSGTPQETPALDEFRALVCGPQPAVGRPWARSCTGEIPRAARMRDGVALRTRARVILGAREARFRGSRPRGEMRDLRAARGEGPSIARILTGARAPPRPCSTARPRGALRRARPFALERHVVTQALVKGFDAPVLDLRGAHLAGARSELPASVGRVLPHPATGKRRPSYGRPARRGLRARALLEGRTWSRGAQGDVERAGPEPLPRVPRAILWPLRIGTRGGGPR